MQVRLSTFILDVLLVITLSGWLLERANWSRDRKELNDQVNFLQVEFDDHLRPLTSGCLAELQATYSTELYLHHLASEESSNEMLMQQSIASLLEVWRQRDNIDLYWAKSDVEFGKPASVITAAGVLASHGHQTPDESLTVIQEMEFFRSNPKLYPEIFAPTSEAYVQFRQFLEDALKVAHQRR